VADAAGEANLEDIWAHTFERWSLEQAEHYVGELALGVRASRAARVEKATESCGQRLLALHGRFHVVFYRETAESLDVIRVLHQRMDVDRHL